ncbi:APC family permease [Rhodococcus olei]|uniref:APC family permease n=1 Tax=Rhodococcus olei TaxID=2161675 RepID=UPI0031E6D8DF
MRNAGHAAATGETPAYLIKRLLLGRPLITRQIRRQHLSNPVALGVLSPDAISSSAYGTEEILIELLPYAGLAAYVLLLPVTGVILGILILVTASYRQVVTAYTRAGGSYVVARDNLGPRIAQIAAAALLVDYVVTVAVQSAAGTVAVVSAVPALGPYSVEIAVASVLAMLYGNLRGVREAGRLFAMPTYFFIAMLTLTIIVGVFREIVTGLPRYDPEQLTGAVPVHQGNGLVMGATVLILLRAFANGGSSLTGIEAISNSIRSFREPVGRNARLVLTVMAGILGFLVAGVSYLAFATHATPYQSGYPSVLAEIARAVFGGGPAGHVLYLLVQVATAAILFTGANTSFNGFPALADFVAEDRFLPRQLARRGHRLVFSNGIVVLAVLSIVLLVVSGGSVNALVPLYAIGVFTGFAMAGLGMTRYHLSRREHGWRHRLSINLAAGVVSTVVVAIFAVAKFTEGAWLVVVVFPLLVWALIGINHEYRTEAAILDRLRAEAQDRGAPAEHHAIVCADALDLAVLEALRYGRSLGADSLFALHLVVDAEHADRLRKRWDHYGIDAPLHIVDCPDRRIAPAARDYVIDLLERTREAHVTVLLPRRVASPVLGRLLHGRTGDAIAREVSRIPDAVATVVPFDVRGRVRPPSRRRLGRLLEHWQCRVVEADRQRIESYEHPAPSGAAVQIGRLTNGVRTVVQGRVEEIDEESPDARAISVGDDSGTLLLRVTEGKGGRRDLEVGQLLRVTGVAQRNEDAPESDAAFVMVDPTWWAVEDRSE